jgi:hypothetical protein
MRLISIRGQVEGEHPLCVRGGGGGGGGGGGRGGGGGGGYARATRTKGGECAHFAGALHLQNEHFDIENVQERSRIKSSIRTGYRCDRLQKLTSAIFKDRKLINL